ncbi:hypothetical protein Hanom_Chr17g01586901 [Helianthus anomalus]
MRNTVRLPKKYTRHIPCVYQKMTKKDLRWAFEDLMGPTRANHAHVPQYHGQCLALEQICQDLLKARVVPRDQMLPIN